MRPIVIERRIVCAADVCTVWREVTDTNRLNKSAGMGPLKLSFLNDASAARYVASTVLGGFRVDFEELPFEWKEFESFESIRTMRSGPLLEVRTRFDFAPADADQTTVTLRLWIVPRIAILRPILSLAANQSARNLERAIQQLDRERVASGPRARAKVNVDALERGRQALEKRVGADLATRVASYVRDEMDTKLERIRPYELADAWGLERTAVLTACLEGVGAGLLELRWDIICPSCRTASARVPKLSELPAGGHCQLCELDFEMNLDRAVEATFSPHPSIHDVAQSAYCIGGPARTPHVYAQTVALKGKRVKLPVPPMPGRYKLFARGGAIATIDVDPDAPAEVEALASNEIRPDRIRVAPGGTIDVVNEGDGDRHVKLERLEWLNAAATAHEVSMLAPFRRVFSSEVLSTGTVLRVAKVAFLFSDLTASTALYSNAGDAGAYKLVHEHFQLLTGIIERNHGSVVKTMGDAVMAAFVDELSGLDAATEMLEAFYRFRHGRALCDNVFLKLGLHAGASYVVSANQALDYFGQTVNIASRLQAKAESSELVTDAETFFRAEESRRLGKLVMTELFDATLKGVDVPLPCVRLRLGSEVARSVRPPADIARSLVVPSRMKPERKEDPS